MKVAFSDISPSATFQSRCSAMGITLEEVTAHDLRNHSAAILILGPSSSELSAPKEDKAAPHQWRIQLISKLSQKSEMPRAFTPDCVWPVDSWEELFFHNLAGIRQRLSFPEQIRDLHLEWTQTTSTLAIGMELQLEILAELQRALIPRSLPNIQGIELCSRYFPASGLGGDYFDVLDYGDKKRFGFLVADSDSHGIVAALLSALLKLQLEDLRDKFPEPLQVTSHLVESVTAQNAAKKISLLYGILDRPSLRFRFATYGTLKPALWRKGAWSSVPLQQGTHPLSGSVQLQPGDWLILHSDGLVKRIPEVFKSVLPDFFNGPTGEDALALSNLILGVLGQRSERAVLTDDLTFLAFRVTDRVLFVPENQST